MQIIFTHQYVQEYEGDEGYLTPSFGFLDLSNPNFQKYFEQSKAPPSDIITFITAMDIDESNLVLEKLSNFLNDITNIESKLIITDKFGRSALIDKSFISLKLCNHLNYEGQWTTNLFFNIMKNWVIYLKSNTKTDLIVDIPL